jgi:cyanate permease
VHATTYLTYWFPARRRALMQALFTTSIPLSVILGAPISGWIMGSLGGRAGLANWQWLFLLEGIPSIVVGLSALAIVADKPSQARWLSEREKQLVLADLDADHVNTGPRTHGFREALRHPGVWLLTVIYFCATSSPVTIGFWIPSIIQSLGVNSNITIGLLSAVPYIGAMIGMVLVGRHSDRALERRYHASLAYLVSAIGLVGIGVFANSPALAFTSLVIAVTAPLSGHQAFWQMPTMLLAGTAAATGIALINSIGNLSGWIGPSVVGWLEDLTGKTSTGLYVLAGLEVLAAVLILFFMPHRSVSTGETPPKCET